MLERDLVFNAGQILDYTDTLPFGTFWELADGFLKSRKKSSLKLNNLTVDRKDSTGETILSICWEAQSKKERMELKKRMNPGTQGEIRSIERISQDGVRTPIQAVDSATGRVLLRSFR